jgi:hypothetical protein
VSIPRRPAEVLFVFIGGAHQVFHLAPVAAAMTKLYPGLQVTCVYRGAETGALLEIVREDMQAGAMRLAAVEPPRWSRLLARLLRWPSVDKLPLLRRIARLHPGPVAAVTPERTSAWLRHLGMRHTPMIHFRHGAGDRAPGSERRLKAFDLIVVPGRKDIERAVTVHGIERARLRATGYVKFDYLARRRPRGVARLFGNDRPVVLYNPHFDPAISSWRDARAVIDLFARQQRYNLVVAPHLRIAETLTPREAEAWASLSVSGRILVDLDSPRLVDMTYARAAGIYLGDMSSQLYEFLLTPRPAVFLNSHKAAWENNPKYAGWKLGVVAGSVEELLDAVDLAVATHAGMAAAQEAALVHAVGEWRGASRRGAEITGAFLGLEADAESTDAQGTGAEDTGAESTGAQRAEAKGRNAKA